MKTFVQKFRIVAVTVVALAASTSVVLAGGNDTQKAKVSSLQVSIVPQSEPKMVRLAFQNNSDSPVTVKVFDAEHHQLLSSKTYHNKHIVFKKYNFAKVPAGQYSIELSNATDTYVESINF